jgi:hypothetical protein
MLRELAKLSMYEVAKWVDDRRVEASWALLDQRISDEVYNAIAEWIEDSYISYLSAVHLGLITPQQVDGEGGGSER